MTNTTIVAGLPRTPFEQKAGQRDQRPTGLALEPRKISHVVNFACGCFGDA